MSIGNYVLDELRKRFEVEKKDIGRDGKLDAKGMHFLISRYAVKGVGNLCLIDMKAMLGLMKMQTVVLSVAEKDVPLLNFDTVKVLKNGTYIAELYDTMLGERDEELVKTCESIKEADSDLPGYVSGAHWYDSLLYPCSYAKKLKGSGDRVNESLKKYFDAFMKSLGAADICDPATKKKRISDFANGLIENGGPAVDQVKKLFGEDLAKRLVLGHMYGIDD
ncbi:MAG: hypothetical protein IKN92_06365 [Clostridia bacterium]|nr:hypothetical protein [Clostridia bacterium]